MQNLHLGLIAALVKFQAECPSIPKNKTAGKGSFAYKYADLADIFSVVTPVLSKHGLALTQIVNSKEDGRDYLLSILCHVEGGLICSEVRLPTSTKIQDYGSMLTYLRRYSASALLGIASQDDTDAYEIDNTPKDKHQAIDSRPISIPIIPIQEPKPLVISPQVKTMNDVFTLAHSRNVPNDQVKEIMFNSFRKHSSKELIQSEIDQLFKIIGEMK